MQKVGRKNKSAEKGRLPEEGVKKKTDQER